MGSISPGGAHLYLPAVDVTKPAKVLEKVSMDVPSRESRPDCAVLKSLTDALCERLNRCVGLEVSVGLADRHIHGAKAPSWEMPSTQRCHSVLSLQRKRPGFLRA